jgi:phosphoribosylformylglycinamidine cyclo-ligase
VKTNYRHYRVKRIVHGIAHITGGGLIDNPPRILPDGCALRLRRGSWTIPPVFPWLQALGPVPDAEMYRVFNMGIGMVAVVAPERAATIQSLIPDARVIGEVTPRGDGPAVRILGVT